LANNDAGPVIASALRGSGSADIVLSVTTASNLVSTGTPATKFKVFAAGTTTPAIALDGTTPITVGTNTITLKLASVPINANTYDVYAFYPPDTVNAGQTSQIYNSTVDADGLTVGRQLTASITPVNVPAAVAATGQNLTMTTPTYAAGGSGFGQELTAGYGVTPNNDGGPTSVPYTLESRLVLDTVPGSTKVFCGQGDNCWIGVNSSGNLIANYRSSGGDIDLVTATPITTATRHHVALVVTASGTKLYFNGTEVATNATAGVVSARNTVFGVRTAGFGPSTFEWPGKVDEFAIWHIAKYTSGFTPATSPYVGNESGLYQLWHLDNNGNSGKI
jgi:hypothetical protein